MEKKSCHCTLCKLWIMNTGTCIFNKLKLKIERAGDSNEAGAVLILLRESCFVRDCYSLRSLLVQFRSYNQVAEATEFIHLLKCPPVVI